MEQEEFDDYFKSKKYAVYFNDESIPVQYIAKTDFAKQNLMRLRGSEIFAIVDARLPDPRKKRAGNGVKVVDQLFKQNSEMKKKIAEMEAMLAKRDNAQPVASEVIGESNQDKQEIIELFKQGVEPKEIAKKKGIHTNTVKKHLREYQNSVK